VKLRLRWQCIMHNTSRFFTQVTPFITLDGYLGGLTLVAIGHTFVQRMFSSIGKADSSCPSLTLCRIWRICYPSLFFFEPFFCLTELASYFGFRLMGVLNLLLRTAYEVKPCL
jgi:hypothetical protein